MRVLFVCTGNTCRSPMAEAILTKSAAEKGLNILCDSAGIFASEGREISQNAKEVLRSEYGILWDKRSKPVTKDLLQTADFVIAVTENHKNLLLQSFGVNALCLPSDVGDPYGGDLAAYKKAAREIKEGIEILIAEGVIHD